MATSFTSHAGSGFWTADAKLELWLFLLGDAVRAEPGDPGWLQEAAEHWRLQATVGFTGCVDAGLDRFLGADPERIAAARRVSARARHLLLGHGTQVPVPVRDEPGPGGRSGDRTRTLDVSAIVPVADAFDRLLDGELTWDARTSPVL